MQLDLSCGIRYITQACCIVFLYSDCYELLFLQAMATDRERRFSMVRTTVFVYVTQLNIVLCSLGKNQQRSGKMLQQLILLCLWRLQKLTSLVMPMLMINYFRCWQVYMYMSLICCFIYTCRRTLMSLQKLEDNIFWGKLLKKRNGC